ncbi:hypothetical protein [Sphingomonas sp. BK580]|uniref:hypothetical protein n=1 Tax=Sphingomonas sp. BK580 TaxID=2586972 RepID=UPI001611A5C8|nr:hypothetical protein [Sphingomonas sp. BK580]MBB3691442.1 putative membrane protein [Sphingomonas sp. BK580]
MTPAAAFALLRRFWPALPIVGLAIAVLVMRAQLADARHHLALERSQATAAAERARRELAELETANAQREAKGNANFADRLAAQRPVIVRSTNTVRKYAQTDAGRTRCLAPDGVRSFAEDRADLFAVAPSTSGGSDAVPTERAVRPE